MEKPARSKENIFSIVTRSTSLRFQNPPPICPGHDNWSKFKAKSSRGFSGPPPCISIIPAEARRKSTSESSCFDAGEEPISPKVSCMGQIKDKHKKLKNKKQITSKSNTPPLSPSPKEAKKKPPSSAILKIFRIGKPKCSDLVFDDPDSDGPVQVQVQGGGTGRAPSLGQMNRFASSRDSHSLANFDWTTHVPVASDGRNDHSGEER